jgi:hypothetical protein
MKTENKVAKAWKVWAIILICLCAFLIWQTIVDRKLISAYKDYGQSTCELLNKESSYLNEFDDYFKEKPLTIFDCSF